MKIEKDVEEQYSREDRRYYVDTAPLIDFLWQKFITKKTKPNSISNMILSDPNYLAKYVPLVSTFSRIEIESHFRNYFLLRETISSGYGYREFQRVKQDFEISSADKKIVTDIGNFLEKNPDFDFVDVISFGKQALGRVRYYMSNHMDFFDAAHLQIALDAGCNGIVIRDSEFRKRASSIMSKIRKKENKISILTEKGIKSIMDRIK